MSRRLVRAVVPVGLAAAAALTLAACGNTVAFQSQEHPVVAGVEATLGTVLIRNATITIDPDGTSARLLLVMFNEGKHADALTSVSSPRVAQVRLPPAAPAADSVTGSATASPTVTETALAPPSTPATAASTSAAPGASTSAPPASATQVELPPMSTVPLRGAQAITLDGISGGPRVGNSLPITFQFAAAGSVSLLVPITDDLYDTPMGAQTFARNQNSAGLETYASESPGVPRTPPPVNSTDNP